MLFGTILAFPLAETVVRLFFEEPILPRFVIDPGYGVRANQPNVVTRHSVPGDYEVEVTTNSAGMRGQREYPLQKSSGVVRIALLGDSFIFGRGVPDNEVIGALLEDKLTKVTERDNMRFEVLNFAVAGFGQAEELVTFRHKTLAYQPDEVVIFYFSNDIGNNAVAELFEVDAAGILSRTGNEYLPGVKAREALYSIAPIRWLFTHSQAWNLVRNRLSGIVQKSYLKKQGLEGFSDTKPAAVKLTRALFKQFIEEIKNHGAHPTVFIIPGKKLNSNFPLTPEEVAETGATLIDGRSFLETGDYYNRDSHWRASGHQKGAAVLAEMITSRIRQKLQSSK